MPDFNIIKSSKLIQSFRTKSIIGQFDLQLQSEINEQFIGNIAIENEQWQIGLIVGASGSGKSTIARELFPDSYINEFDYDSRSVVDNMPENYTTEQITSMFNSVGFATVWSWLKPYHVLSNGEKMRVDLARAILSTHDEQTIVFDEFTSVVDRTIAKTASCAISKAIRKTNKKFIAVACHRDIIEWLQPDWIYDTDEQRFFFIQTATKSNDQNYKSTYDVVRPIYGDYLESIII